MKNPPKPQKELLELLFSKYQADPEGFRSYMPEAAQLLDAMYPPRRPSRSPFGLTERERAHHLAALREVLEGLEESSISPKEAVKGLQHCATLIQDDNLPEDVGYETLVFLMKAAIGKSPGTFKSAKTVLVMGDEGREVINRVSLVRGVTLDLDRNMRLVSITVAPTKVRERRKLLKLIGLGQDIASDVALRHDDYLAEQEPHASH